MIFGFLNKILEIFFEKVGDKWKQYTEDQNLTIEGITTLFNKYQEPKNADNLTKALH